MATIASVSVAVTWVGDDDQGLLENGRFFSTTVANWVSANCHLRNGDTPRMSELRHDCGTKCCRSGESGFHGCTIPLSFGFVSQQMKISEKRCAVGCAAKTASPKPMHGA